MQASLRGFVQRTYMKATPEKDEVRQETINSILEYFTKKKAQEINFLTLPCSPWRFEKYISKRIRRHSELGTSRIHFTGCERDWKVYQAGCLWIAQSSNQDGVRTESSPELNCQVTSNQDYAFLHCDIFDYAEKIKKKFQCVWLDTTTTIAVIDDRLKHIDNVVEKGSMVILTIMAAREHRKLPMDRMDYIASLVDPLGLRLVKQWEYQDSVPMLQQIYIKTRKSQPISRRKQN